MKRLSLILGSIILFLIVDAVLCISAEILALPAVCGDVRANLTHYTDECRAAIRSEHHQ